MPRVSRTTAALVGTLALALAVILTLVVILMNRTAASSPATPVGTTAGASHAQPLAVVSDCVTNYDGLLAAIVTVTNTTDHVHGYSVHVAFDSADGTSQLGTGTGYVAAIQPYERSPVDVTGNVQAPRAPVLGSISVAAAYRCRLVSVIASAG